MGNSVGVTTSTVAAGHAGSGSLVLLYQRTGRLALKWSRGSAMGTRSFTDTPRAEACSKNPLISSELQYGLR